MDKILIKAVVGAVIDRVDSCLPPCTPADEFNTDSIKGYIHGVLECACATVQCLSVHEVFMTDIYEILDPLVNDFIKSRLENSTDYSFPELQPVIDEIYKQIT